MNRYSSELYCFSDEQRDLFDKMIQCIQYGEKTIEYGKNVSSKEALIILKGAIAVSDPEAVAYSSVEISSSHSLRGSKFVLIKNKKVSNHMVRSYCDRVNEIIRDTGVNRLADDIEKIKAIYDYFVETIEYNGNDYVLSHSGWGAIMERKAVCEGISLAFSHIMNVLQIPCIVISGYNNGEGADHGEHMWNLVKTSKGCYHIDVTNGLLKVFDRKKTAYDYFLLSDEEISLDHEWEKGNVIACNWKEYSYFCTEKIYASNFIELKEIIRRQVREDTGFIYFKVNNSVFKEPERISEIVMEQISKWYKEYVQYSYTINKELHIFHYTVFVP